MSRKFKNILWGVIGIMLLGTGIYIYAGTGLKMSFEEAQQRKESRKKPETSGNKYQAMSKEQWESMSAEEKEKYQRKQIQLEAAKESEANLKLLKIKIEEGTLYPPDSEDRTIIELAAAKEKKAVPLLIDVLHGYPVPEARVDAAKALGSIKEESAIPALIEALEDKDYRVKTQAAIALVEFDKNEMAFPILFKIALKEDIDNWNILYEPPIGYLKGEARKIWKAERIRQIKEETLPSSAVTALCKIGDQKSFETIKKVLKDDNWNIKINAAKCILEKEDNKEAVLVLVSIARDETLNKFARGPAINLLAKSKSDLALNTLNELKNSRDSYIRKEAQKALKQLRR